MSGPLGAEPGSNSLPDASGLTSDFTTIPDQTIEAVSDRVQPRQVASGLTRGVQQLGSDRVYSDGGNNQIIVEDSTNPKVLMGDQTTFGEGFYVAKDGVNAKTNTDPNGWIFNSNQNVLKVFQSGTLAVPAVSIISGQSFITIEAFAAWKKPTTNIPAIQCFIFSAEFNNYVPLPSGVSNTVITGYAALAGSPINEIVSERFTVYSTTAGLFIEHDLFNSGVSPTIAFTGPAALVKYFAYQESILSA